MKIDNILIISPPNYSHIQSLYEVAHSFHQSIPDSVITNNPDECEGRSLVFGAHLIPKFNATMDGDYIIYQTEQLGANDSLFADEAYLDLLRRFPVWDYSLNNISYLKTKVIEATHVPIGYSKCMSNIKTGKSLVQVGGGKNGKQRIDFAEWSGEYPKTDINGKFIQDIDVCFYGSVNERRMKIIDELKSKTLSFIDSDGSVKERPLVVASFMGYGGFRDKLIARSKIVLNMHFYDSAIFEIFRCSHLYANKTCVVSEIGKDISLEEPYAASGGFVQYHGIVDRCMALLSDDNERHSMAEYTYNIFKQKTQSDILKGIL